jgi:hypothetical protein
MLSKLIDLQNWKTGDNQRNVNEVIILYKMIHHRLAIDLNLHVVPQLTSCTQNACRYLLEYHENNYKMIQQTSNFNYIGTSRHSEKHNLQLLVVMFYKSYFSLMRTNISYSSNVYVKITCILFSPKIFTIFECCSQGRIQDFKLGGRT